MTPRRANASRLRTIWPARIASLRTSSRSVLVDALRLVEHELGAADDRLQRVVDLVRDAGNQLADRREPLAVHELVAQREVFGHVALDADEMRDAAGLVADRGDRARRRKRRPVLAPALERAAPDALRHHLGGNVALQVVHPGLDEIDEASAS